MASERHSTSTLRGNLEALRIDRAQLGPRPTPLWVKALAVALLIAAAALGLAVYQGWIGASPQVRVALAVRGAPPAGVVMRPQVALTGSGYVITEAHYISLGVRVSGRITAYQVAEGERVEQGQELVRLDDRPFRAEIARLRAERAVAEANIALFRKELVRLQQLYQNEVASESLVDRKENELRIAQAERARAQASIDRLEIDLEDTVIRAPVAGLVLEKLKEVGEIATPGGFAGSGELIRLANLEEIRAEVDVNESDLSRISLGQRAEVIPDADPSRRYAAEVVKLAPQVNRQKGTLKVEVRIQEPDAWLRPDMSARIDFFDAPEPSAEPGATEVASGPGEGSVLADAAALRRDGGEAFVWVVTEGRLRRQVVEPGPRSADRVQIRSGLFGGEALVVGDVDGLSEGQAVEIAPQ